MALLKPKYLTPITAHFDDDGDPVPFLTGNMYSSPLVDRTTTPTFAEYVQLGFWCDAAVPNNGVEVYIYSDMGDNHSNPPESDSDKRNWINESVTTAGTQFVKWKVTPEITSTTALSSMVKHVGTLDFLAQYDSSYMLFNVATYFGGIIPPRFAILVKNNTGDDIIFYGPNGQSAWCQILGVQAEVV